MPRPSPLRARDLQRWRLLATFQTALAATIAARRRHPSTWEHPQRQLELGQYLSLFLFGLLNPVVQTMRGLCAASEFQRVQREVSGRPVSLGSFSEAQAVVEPALLRAVFDRLRAQTPAPPAPWGPSRARSAALAIDSTVWPALPRMVWAFWRRQGPAQNAVRLHVEFDLARGGVRRAELTPAKICERAQWKKWAQPGACYVGDRYFGQDYALLAQLQERGVDFVVRLRQDAQWVEENAAELTAADRAAGVTWAGPVRLGHSGAGPRVRVVQVLGEAETVLLATSLTAEAMPPELVAQLYRHRWQVELFFRWLKCILGCRHWLAESARGVALQCYLALIAAQLLVLHTGRRPGRRQMEAIQFYLLGWASAAEVACAVTRGPKKS